MIPKTATPLCDLIEKSRDWKLSEADRDMSGLMSRAMAPMTAENALKRFVLMCRHFRLDPDVIAENLNRGMRGE